MKRIKEDDEPVTNQSSLQVSTSIKNAFVEGRKKYEKDPIALSLILIEMLQKNNIPKEVAFIILFKTIELMVPDKILADYFVLFLEKDHSKIVNSLVSLRKKLNGSNNDDPSNSFEEHVVKCGLLLKMINFFETTEDDVMQLELAWCLSNISSTVTENVEAMVACGVVPILIRLFSSPSTQVVEQSIWCIGNIAGESNYFRDLVLENNVMKPLLSSIEKIDNNSFRRNAAWALSNFFRGGEHNFENWNRVSESLPLIKKFITTCDDQSVVSDAYWSLEFLTSYPQNWDEHVMKIQSIIDQDGLLEYLVKETDNNLSFKVLVNMLSGSEEQIQTILEIGMPTPNFYGIIEDFYHRISFLELTVKTHDAIRGLGYISNGNSYQIQHLFNPVVSRETRSQNNFLINVLGRRLENPLVVKIFSNIIQGGTPYQIKSLLNDYEFVPRIRFVKKNSSPHNAELQKEIDILIEKLAQKEKIFKSLTPFINKINSESFEQNDVVVLKPFFWHPASTDQFL